MAKFRRCRTLAVKLLSFVGAYGILMTNWFPFGALQLVHVTGFPWMASIMINITSKSTTPKTRKTHLSKLNHVNTLGGFVHHFNIISINSITTNIHDPDFIFLTLFPTPFFLTKGMCAKQTNPSFSFCFGWANNHFQAPNNRHFLNRWYIGENTRCIPKMRPIWCLFPAPLNFFIRRNVNLRPLLLLQIYHSPCPLLIV